METLKKTLIKLQKYRQFRILFSKIYPMLEKLKLIPILKHLNKGSFSDNWEPNKDKNKYDLLFKRYGTDYIKLIKLKKKYVFGFLINTNIVDLTNIKNACNSIGVDFLIYDIKNPSLYYEIQKSNLDGLFIIPTFENNLIRNLFHEATQILGSETSIMIYPSIRELNIYESKRTLANFLKINNIPHPATSIFYNYESAKEYIEKASYPIVFKTHIGASASGVEILKNKKEALQLANHLFTKYYLRKMETDKRAIEWDYMIIQEYIDDVKEYRVIKIGDSWFSYQKWKTSDQVFMSGSGVNKWINPPEDLLDFCYNISTKHHFTTMSFDIFENKKGDLMVNELQTWFGSYNPSQMYLADNTPGRYRKVNGRWIFETGLFNIDGSILLRLVHLIAILQKERNQ
jgi:hypothetical protein